MKKIIITACAVFLIFSIVSCGSKEAPEPEKTPEPPVIEKPEEKPVVEEKTPEPEPVVEEVSYKEANDEALAKIDGSRNAAIEAGADTDAQEELAKLDAMYEDLRKRAENNEDISEESLKLEKLYNALAAYAKAKRAKQKADEAGLAEYAQKDYDEGLAAMEAVSAPDASADFILEKSNEAYVKFNTVCIVGFKALAREARENAMNAKKQAESVKAQIAEKERYTQAAEQFKKGDALYAMQSAEKALNCYLQSEDIFETLWEELFEKRAAVQRAIDEAKKKVAESAEFAQKADEEAPIPENSDLTDYIEDEDATLLEEDDYENPEEAQADIPETLPDDEDSDDDSYDDSEEELSDNDFSEESFDDEEDDLDEENIDETEEEAL